MSKPHIWLRAETKPMEERTPLTPKGCGALIKADFRVTVERASQSAYEHSDYTEAGCESAEPGSWPEAPEGAFILGLKELPDDTFPLKHSHIYFAHAYKNQRGRQDLLRRFVKGGGKLYDLEYLVDENKRRIAAFGYWAGFAGCAAGMLAWANQKRGMRPGLSSLSSYKSKAELIQEISDSLASVDARPRILVIGSKGRCGTGASDAGSAAGAEVVGWDLEETKSGGPFAEINEMDIFVNCVFVNRELPPFVTTQQLGQPGRKLSVIVDVSCDVNSSFNPVPIYTEGTDFDHPCLELFGGDNPLDVIAIDHLPSLLPLESSEDYGGQLVKHLLNLGDASDAVWNNALKVFNEKTEGLGRE